MMMVAICRHVHQLMCCLLSFLCRSNTMPFTLNQALTTPAATIPVGDVPEALAVCRDAIEGYRHRNQALYQARHRGKIYLAQRDLAREELAAAFRDADAMEEELTDELELAIDERDAAFRDGNLVEGELNLVSDELAAACRDAEAELAEKDALIRTVVDERTEAQRQVSEAQGEITRLDNLRVQLSKEKDTATSEKDTAVSGKNILESEKAALVKELAKLQGLHDTVLRKNEELTGRISILEGEHKAEISNLTTAHKAELDKLRKLNGIAKEDVRKISSKRNREWENKDVDACKRRREVVETQIGVMLTSLNQVRDTLVKEMTAPLVKEGNAAAE